ncbi:MAG: hypothetical protein IPP34_13675 [Bacteroidetes bacterium]|nr:hypothetical protein [Bacteroidota bacterium]
MEKIKIRLFIFFLWLGACTPTFAQNRNSIWVFGDSSMVDFGNAGSPVIGVSGMDGRGSCVSIADTAGNLLFMHLPGQQFQVVQALFTISNIN